MFRRLALLLFFGLWLSIYLGGQPTSPIQPEYADEIRRLAVHPEVIMAFALIEEDALRTRRELIQLTEVPAPPFGERDRAKLFADMLRGSMTVDSVWIDHVGNVIGLLKGKVGDRTVGIDAHLDTVFPEGTDVTVTERGDTLFAPGIADDTRGLSMLLSIMRAIKSADVDLRDNVLVIGSVGEEGLGDLRGVKYLFREDGPNIDAWISIDGGGLGRISNQGLGSFRYKVTFRGPGGHSWGAFGMVNPHHALSTAVHYFDQAAPYITETGPRTSYNVGRIGGGTSVNSIPFESWMEVDMRSVSPTRLNSLDSIFHESMWKALHAHNSKASIGDTLTLEIELIGNRPSGELSANLPLIQRAMAATAFIGKVPKLTRGSTNSNIPIALGIPAVTIGHGGKGGKAHSLGEWWLDDEGYRATQLAFLLLVAESGLVSD